MILFLPVLFDCYSNSTLFSLYFISYLIFMVQTKSTMFQHNYV